ncbi:hypothetical protein [Burkholderia plantarii]|uniref:hypothetical protein n=1 Tax=Burkholderia plantarii TaxID=41899 RepID=UPI000AE156DD|nr:hypothetical protein [Burkholderia plantarii]
MIRDRRLEWLENSTRAITLPFELDDDGSPGNARLARLPSDASKPTKSQPPTRATRFKLQENATQAEDQINEVSCNASKRRHPG